jgi:hypothetical protein
MIAIASLGMNMHYFVTALGSKYMNFFGGVV